MANYFHQTHVPQNVVVTYQDLDNWGLQQYQTCGELMIQQSQMYRDPTVPMQFYNDHRIPQPIHIYRGKDLQRQTVYRAAGQEEHPLPLHCFESYIPSKSYNSYSDIVANYDNSTRERAHVHNFYHKGFTLDANLQRDHFFRTGYKSYVCGDCNKSFKSKRALKSHSAIHTGQKPYVCNICERRFSDKSNRRKHYKIHTGEKDHICKICNKSFIRNDRLRSHYKKHTKDREFNGNKKNIEETQGQNDHVIAELVPLLREIIEAMVEEKRQLIQVQSEPNHWWINYTGTRGYEEQMHTNHNVNLDDYVQAFNTFDQQLAHVLRQGLNLMDYVSIQ